MTAGLRVCRNGGPGTIGGLSSAGGTTADPGRLAIESREAPAGI